MQLWKKFWNVLESKGYKVSCLYKGRNFVALETEYILLIIYPDGYIETYKIKK